MCFDWSSALSFLTTGVPVPMMELKDSCASEGSHETESAGTGNLPGPLSWHLFAQRSTLHGLRYVFPHRRSSALRRLLWSAALLACLGLLALEAAERVAHFLSYPHVASVGAVPATSLVFPAVTVCNLNAYRFTRLTRNDLYHAGELLALLDVHLHVPEPQLAEPHVLDFLAERANFSGFRPKPFSMREFTERVGHDLHEMMLYCRYEGQECSHRDFKTVSLLFFIYICIVHGFGETGKARLIVLEKYSKVGCVAGNS
ncbi:hypothetical protein PDJAM_G00043110 [Pangasius djambal]|uniref:Uncharacterized protein n=1 Tax=Pangasius djambal TaxID=1691987 RepID=A0ACC5YU76_9TELE|nr:hypothetical protein [Pangasius djambal]